MISSYDDSRSDEEWDLFEEDDIAMILALHANKMPKHGGFVFGRERLRMNYLRKIFGELFVYEFELFVSDLIINKCYLFV
jgi:hypothetical protein